ncbi:MAG: DHHA1 domain-containing protein [Candidatus Omnitrophica bacterium]|nr:DHHA1 domain-containing protein [Candidatus Omnitrophota bacterium]
MRGLEAAKRAIREATSVAISGHVNPDGDSIGSLLSLGLGIERMGKRVLMVSVDGVPRRYRELPAAGRIVRAIKKPVDLAIAVDCSSKDILGKTYQSFKNAGTILEIDHHEFRRPFGNVSLVDAHAAAVGEMIYRLLKSLKVRITVPIAQNLLTSIIVETNSFKLPNVTPFTFKVCTDLINSGVDFYELVDTVFWSKRKSSAVLSGICMARCIFLKRGRIAWSIVTRKDFNAAHGKDEDVDAVPDDMRAIEGVKVAVLFREKDDHTLRVSLRSKGKLNVADLAESYGGGGHFDVAGCSISNSPSSIRVFLKDVERLVF